MYFSYPMNVKFEFNFHELPLLFFYQSLKILACLFLIKRKFGFYLICNFTLFCPITVRFSTLSSFNSVDELKFVYFCFVLFCFALLCLLN